MRGLIWFREDLRIDDNTALHYAAKHCTNGLAAIYIINPEMWLAHDTAACRVDFILRGLNELKTDLDNLFIPLIILTVKNTESISTEILRVMQEIKADALFFNRQYEVNESKRDHAVQDFLSKHKITCYSYDDQTILPPQSVMTKNQQSYKVFTPYKRAWQQAFLLQKNVKLYAPPKSVTTIKINSLSIIPTSVNGFVSTIDPALWPAGEKEAKKRLARFIKNNLFNYDTARDFPSLNATSQLSPYLATGMISPRRCFLAALDANQHEVDTGNKVAVCWMSELIWREFYKSILISTPRISMHRAYQLETEKIQWLFDKKKLIAWQEGKTGFPIIDAAMRQLNTTGWMHNRLRMITAMFFAKNLFFDWRIGEKYFMNHLIDGDLAANNGGWQWCASTGTDAAPYFRIFNPVTQSQRFDPEGEFIRLFCPELAKLNSKEIHKPSALAIVNLEESRKHAIKVFKAVTS